MRLYDGDTFEHAGATFRVTMPYDECGEAPWDREDGHGHVSGWERRSKSPGERVLCEDRGSYRFYSMSPKDACKEWGIESRERAAELIQADYDRLHGWCLDRWTYVGVVVELLDDDGQGTGIQASLWGIESDASAEYMLEVAHDCATEALAEAKFCVTCHAKV